MRFSAVHFVALCLVPSLRLEAQLLDTAGMVLHYSVKTSVAGLAPARLTTQVMVHNRSALLVRLQYSNCSVRVRAFNSRSKTKNPVWISEKSGSPFSPESNAWCITQRNMYVNPGDSAPMIVSLPTYEILGDTLPDGRYYFTAEFSVNRRPIELDAGSATITKKQEPIPASRTIDGIRFSASLKRITFDSPAPALLELELNFLNTGTTNRRIRGRRYPDCATIVGFDDRARLDTYYMRRASEDRTVSIRTCPLIIPDTTLKPGESHAVSGVIAAPSHRLHYLILFELRNATPFDPEPVDVDLAVDGQ